MSEGLKVQATCVAMPAAATLVGVLLRGKPGSGKSDLALRLIDRGGKLVADDLVLLFAEGGKCIARAPDTICGRMEVRGIGVVSVDSIAAATLGLVVDLDPGNQLPRLAEPDFETFLGITLPRLILNPFEMSAGAKIAIAVQALMRPREAGVTFPFAQ